MRLWERVERDVVRMRQDVLEEIKRFPTGEDSKISLLPLELIVPILERLDEKYPELSSLDKSQFDDDDAPGTEYDMEKLFRGCVERGANPSVVRTWNEHERFAYITEKHEQCAEQIRSEMLPGAATVW